MHFRLLLKAALSKRPLLLLVMVFLFSSVGVSQENKLVESLDIQGNRRLSDKEILAHIKLRPGQPFTEKRAREDLNSLLSLGWFDKANTKYFTDPGMRGGINVIFEIKELPIIQAVEFDISDFFTEEEIISVLKEQKLVIRKGDIYNLQKLRKARGAISDYLTMRGFNKARVIVFEEEIDSTSVLITFSIEI